MISVSGFKKSNAPAASAYACNRRTNISALLNSHLARRNPPVLQNKHRSTCEGGQKRLPQILKSFSLWVWSGRKLSRVTAQAGSDLLFFFIWLMRCKVTEWRACGGQMRQKYTRSVCARLGSTSRQKTTFLSCPCVRGDKNGLCFQHILGAEELWPFAALNSLSRREVTNFSFISNARGAENVRAASMPGCASRWLRMGKNPKTQRESLHGNFRMYTVTQIVFVSCTHECVAMTAQLLICGSYSSATPTHQGVAHL